MQHDPIAILTERFRDAFVEAFGDEYADADPLIRATQDPKFGDFQSNAAMPLAKRLGANPREVASKIVEAVDLDAIAESPEIAGPGFVNLRLKSAALAQLLASMEDERLGVEPAADQRKVVVDLVGVNVAKQMHVGHLRSSIIGDTLCRVLARLGVEVTPQNHLGDWGLQIAMVLASLRERGVNLDRLTVDELERAYRDATLSCKADRRALETAIRLGAGPHRIAAWEEQVAGAEAALERAKSTLVKLQGGDPELVADWEKIIAITMEACYEIYDLLDLQVDASHNRGESFYREKLPEVVRELEEAGLAVESEGALVVRMADENDTPLLIRKSDGGFLYATTDLAALRYRLRDLGAERVIYVVDARQRDHFRKVFEAVRMAGWDQLPDGGRAELVHAAFGAVCGEDGRPLKTRSGENIKLKDLLHEAIRRAAAIVREKKPELPENEQVEVARAVGIGCVKYADLSSQIQKDYVFDWDRMLAFEGNTAAYLQNQFVRIRSISRKAPADIDLAASFSVDHPKEKALALELLRYPSVVKAVGETLEPNRICQYLYELANAYSLFYTECPVLKAESAATRDGRLRLCRLTERVLGDGLTLLGIRTLERM
ncbi:MAG: arginine--tRNA ligase [Phycisphaerales bacterium]